MGIQRVCDLCGMPSKKAVPSSMYPTQWQLAEKEAYKNLGGSIATHLGSGKETDEISDLCDACSKSLTKLYFTWKEKRLKQIENLKI